MTAESEEIKPEQAMRLALRMCEADDKSTEYIIQYLQDFAEVDHDTVIDFLVKEWNMEKVNE